MGSETAFKHLLLKIFKENHFKANATNTKDVVHLADFVLMIPIKKSCSNSLQFNELLHDFYIGQAGIEPATFWSRTRRASPCATARLFVLIKNIIECKTLQWLSYVNNYLDECCSAKFTKPMHNIIIKWSRLLYTYILL